MALAVAGAASAVVNTEAFRRLIAHMEWADAMVWRAVLSHGPGAADEFVRESLSHMHAVQRAYLTGWLGGTPQRTRPDEFPSLGELRDWGRAYYPEVRAFLDSLGESDLRAKPEVLWPELIEKAIGRPPVPIRLADMIYQVVSHGAHHRAQLNRRLRELGGHPPFIDYAAWAWADEPEAPWDPE